METVSSNFGSHCAPPDCAEIVLNVAAGVRIATRGAGAARYELQPALTILFPSLFTSRYSTPGTEAAMRALSSGVSTEKAVASAPATGGDCAISVELMA